MLKQHFYNWKMAYRGWWSSVSARIEPVLVNRFDSKWNMFYGKVKKWFHNILANRKIENRFWKIKVFVLIFSSLMNSSCYLLDNASGILTFDHFVRIFESEWLHLRTRFGLCWNKNENDAFLFIKSFFQS